MARYEDWPDFNEGWFEKRTDSERDVEYHIQDNEGWGRLVFEGTPESWQRFRLWWDAILSALNNLATAKAGLEEIRAGTSPASSILRFGTPEHVYKLASDTLAALAPEAAPKTEGEG